ncbi:MAG: translation initiation factor eIF-1A [Candidatus Njordarchaeia archaeon]|mgnify:CR=1 FL=1|nr:translation initiation factor 1A [Candidatus Korarchaeota archaeon]
MSRRDKKEEDELISSKIVLPEAGDLFGLVLRRLGGLWLEVLCSDEKTRKVRIPGKMRRVRIYEGDIIILKPWYGMQEDERGDVVWKYRKSEIRWLLKSKYAEELKKIIPEDILEEYI